MRLGDWHEARPVAKRWERIPGSGEPKATGGHNAQASPASCTTIRSAVAPIRVWPQPYFKLSRVPLRCAYSHRFHPTEEELVGYYLARKVAAQKIDLDIIQEVDLYRIEPWDLQERCGGGRGGRGARQVPEDDQTSSEWYFFSFKDRKYPSGTRTNRATAAGFWKATGRDKPVTSSRSRGVIGMRKTLVFYRGRAPSGQKTDWIIHEYRLQTNEHAATQEEGWVVCRAFQKPTPNQRSSYIFPAYAAAPGLGGYYDTRPWLHGQGGDLHYLQTAAGAAGAGTLGFPGQGIQYSDDVLESSRVSWAASAADREPAHDLHHRRWLRRRRL
ncbi:hypothetical protein ZWY2020_006698 [Hordeum vulgare]|nr:hypothetical protein ZWY2020_006698 [Hordeum vulgare]